MSTDGRRLRVVTLVDTLRVAGGAEAFAADVVAGLDPARFERTLCVSRWPQLEHGQLPATAQALEAAGVRVLGLSRGAKLDLLGWRPLLALLRRERVDVLHAHMFGSNAWGAVLGGLARTPVVVAHEHTWSFEGRPVRRFVDRELIARRADAFVAVSRADRRRMISVEGIPESKVVFIPNGIPMPAQAPADGDVRDELGIPAEAKVVGTVCSLRPQKALGVLVRAARILAERRPDVQVLVVGGGPEEAPLREMIDRMGLSDTVKPLGLRTDVPRFLSALDVAVSSSDFEGSPLAVMEYMEAGLPVVATRVGGVPDLIEDGVHGRLVERRDPAALAEALDSVLADPAGAREMGRRGRERRRAEFTIEATVERITALYEELLARVGRR